MIVIGARSARRFIAGGQRVLPGRPDPVRPDGRAADWWPAGGHRSAPAPAALHFRTGLGCGGSCVSAVRWVPGLARGGEPHGLLTIKYVCGVVWVMESATLVLCRLGLTGRAVINPCCVRRCQKMTQLGLGHTKRLASHRRLPATPSHSIAHTKCTFLIIMTAGVI